MAKSRPVPIRKTLSPLSERSLTLPPEEQEPALAPRPAIWAEGRQAPSFQPMAFAEAGLLLAREDAGATLDYLSTEAAAGAARIETQDWKLDQRLGRVGRVLPSAPGVARSLEGFAQHADAARRLLYGLPDPEPAPVQTAPQAAPEPAAPPAPKVEPPPAPLDPDLAAIRALLREDPPPPVSPRRPAAPPPANWEVPPPPPGSAPVLRRVLDWSIVRVLAGSVLVFATPIGYGRALYRHLDGADLREIVEDCHRMRIN